jgi:hypothetical protein
LIGPSSWISICVLSPTTDLMTIVYWASLNYRHGR